MKKLWRIKRRQLLLKPAQFDTKSGLWTYLTSTFLKFSELERCGVDEGKLYAMKVLKKASIVQKLKTAEHTRTERQVLEAVRACPFLVTLHYAFQTDAKLHLILDYVAGGELFTHLYQREHFNENEVRIYIAEIILALEHSVSSTATLNWRTSSWTRRVTSCSLTSASRRSSAAERAERTASVAPSSTWRRRWSGVAARAMIL
ncbi:unnamed protein product [Leptidea sinapis]|uniref:Protein kinase domain-containing protein n=1 Tax=Leptidea sinapis TaxID=189913 RepID=A0A5E4QC60_9NEOP|nr:unnamed protein product [Leptidea sinapis]